MSDEFSMGTVKELQDNYLRHRMIVPQPEHAQALTMHLVSSVSTIVAAYGEPTRFRSSQLAPSNQPPTQRPPRSPRGVSPGSSPGSNGVGGGGAFEGVSVPSGGAGTDAYSGFDVSSQDESSAAVTPVHQGQLQQTQQQQQQTGNPTPTTTANSRRHAKFTAFERQRLGKQIADLILDASALCTALDIRLADDENILHPLSLKTPYPGEGDADADFEYLGGSGDHSLGGGCGVAAAGGGGSGGGSRRGSGLGKRSPSAETAASEDNELTNLTVKTSRSGSAEASAAAAAAATAGSNATLHPPPPLPQPQQPTILMDRTSPLSVTIKSVISEEGSPKLGSRDNSTNHLVPRVVSSVGSDSTTTASHRNSQLIDSTTALPQFSSEPDDVTSNDEDTQEAVNGLPTPATVSGLVTHTGGSRAGAAADRGNGATVATGQYVGGSNGTNDNNSGGGSGGGAGGGVQISNTFTRSGSGSNGNSPSPGRGGLYPGVPQVATPGSSQVSQGSVPSQSHPNSSSTNLSNSSYSAIKNAQLRHKKRLDDLVQTIRILDESGVTAEELAQVRLTFIFPVTQLTGVESSMAEDSYSDGWFENLLPGGDKIQVTTDNWNEFKRLIFQRLDEQPNA